MTSADQVQRDEADDAGNEQCHGGLPPFDDEVGIESPERLIDAQGLVDEFLLEGNLVDRGLIGERVLGQQIPLCHRLIGEGFVGEQIPLGDRFIRE